MVRTLCKNLCSGGRDYDDQGCGFLAELLLLVKLWCGDGESSVLEYHG